MPIITRIDKAAGLISHQVEGVLTFDEILKAIQALFSAPDFDNAMGILVDVMPGATSGLSSVEINGIVQALQAEGERRGTGRTALVASTDADYGIVKVLSHVMKGGTRQMQVFRTREAALAWLAS